MIPVLQVGSEVDVVLGELVNVQGGKLLEQDFPATDIALLQQLAAPPVLLPQEAPPQFSQLPLQQLTPSGCMIPVLQVGSEVTDDVTGADVVSSSFKHKSPHGNK